MTTVTFTWPSTDAWDKVGYYCDKDGDRSGRYVRAEIAEGLLAKLRYALDIFDHQPPPVLGGWNWPAIADDIRAEIRRAEEQRPTLHPTPPVVQ